MNKNTLKENFKLLLNANDINDNSKYPNANKGGEFKSVETLVQELFSEQQEQLGMALLEEHMPPSEKEKLLRLLETGELYLHDRTKISIPYCTSLDLSRLLHEETNYGRLITKPVQRVDSYVSAVADSVTQFCFYVAGAIGLGTFFIDIGWLLKHKHDLEIETLQEDQYVKDYIVNSYQQLIHSVNHYARGTESAFTNISVFDQEMLERMDNVQPEVIPYIMEAQKIFLEFFDKGDPCSDGLPYTFPIITINTSNAKSPFMEWVGRLDYLRYNFFLNKDAKFAMCCRFMNNEELMKDLAGSANSFGASPASIGSHRVVTINFNSLALQAKSVYEYYQLVKERCKDSAVLLRSHKDLILKLNEHGVQPLIKQGWINMRRMFSTIGVIGLVEADQTIKKRFYTSNDTIELTLAALNEIVFDLSKEFNLVLNIEQIPGESARFNLAAKDRARFGKTAVPQTFYANQFCPLTDEVDLWHKIDVEGKYYETLTGGGIAHLRCPDRPTGAQFQAILSYALEKGCGHLAFSAVWSCCEHNHTTVGKHTTCPKCGGKIVDYLERIVGYHQKVSAWGARAQNIDFPQRQFLTK